MRTGVILDIRFIHLPYNKMHRADIINKRVTNNPVSEFHTLGAVP